jgi:hypothetical protein
MDFGKAIAAAGRSMEAQSSGSPDVTGFGDILDELLSPMSGIGTLKLDM